MSYSLVLSIIACIGITILMGLELDGLKSQPVNGFRNPVIAIEFAENAEHVDTILTLGSNSEVTIEKLKNHTRIDFAFILAYGFFFISLIYFIFHKSYFVSGVMTLFIIVICGSDVVENITISHILSNIHQSMPLEDQFTILKKATYMKWGLLFLLLTLMFFWSFRTVTLKNKLVSLGYFIILISLIISWLIFISTSWYPHYSQSERASIIIAALYMHGVVLLLILLHPLLALWRGVKLMF